MKKISFLLVIFLAFTVSPATAKKKLLAPGDPGWTPYKDRPAVQIWRVAGAAARLVEDNWTKYAGRNSEISIAEVLKLIVYKDPEELRKNRIDYEYFYESNYKIQVRPKNEKEIEILVVTELPYIYPKTGQPDFDFLNFIVDQDCRQYGNCGYTISADTGVGLTKMKGKFKISREKFSAITTPGQFF